MVQNSLRFLFSSIAALLLFGGIAEASVEVPDSAFGTGAVDSGDPRVETRLVVDVAEATPGSTIRVGVLYTIDPDWHIYWQNSGSSGLPTRVDWEGTEVGVGPLQWPAPEVFAEAGGFIITYGYTNEVLLFAEATVPDTALGSVEIVATTTYLACAEQCIRGRSELRRQLPIAAVAGEAAPEAAPEVVSYFDLATGCVPKSADELGLEIDVSFSHSALAANAEIDIAIEAVNCATPPTGEDQCRTYTLGEEPSEAFLPELVAGVSFDVTTIGSHPSAFSGNFVRLTAFSGPDEVTENQRFAGVLRLLDAGGACIPIAVEAEMPRASSDATVEATDHPIFAAIPSPSEGATTGSDDGHRAASPPDQRTDSPQRNNSISLWLALLYAFLGGLILNVMPCVFPVLALKVHALIELSQKEIFGDQDEKSGRIPALVAYTLGVWTPLWVLAGSIVALKASGHTAAWGVQLQYPILISLVGGLVVAFSANLFGVFEISLGAARLGRVADEATGLKRSFLEGILMVLLATPCSAPMLGPAVGFGLLSTNVAHTLLIFTSVGLGLVFPFAVLVLIPGWVRVLPKPGTWMTHFKELVGFSFLGAVIWLGWIVGQTTGVAGMTRYFGFILAIGLVSWIFGIMQAAEVKLRVGLLVVTLLAGSLGAGLLHFEFVRVVRDEGPIAWQDYDEDAIAAELAAGRPVFVDFTADWCATCKTNERLIIESEPVVAAIEEHNVATYVADWTLPDERIEAALASHGRASVPMYLVYAPTRPNEPVVLPEILTIGRVVSAIEEAASGSE